MSEIESETAQTPVVGPEVTRLDRLGPALAVALGDERWRGCTATLVAGGKSNLTFEIASAAGAVIMRRPPTRALLPRAHDMGREARVQQALAATDVPVARIVLADEGDLIGVPCYVMEKVEGHVIRDHLPEGYAADRAGKAAVADGLTDTLVALHAVDAEAVGLADYGRPEGFLERQLGMWNRQWDKAKTHDVPQMDALAAALGRRVPVTQRHTVIHGDYRLDNCVMALGAPGRVAAVLDWELSTLGDPLADLALFMAYWGEKDGRALALVPRLTRGPDFPERTRLQDRYAARTGLDLTDLGWYEGFAHFKFAAIAQGIAARVAAGAMGGQDFGDLDDEVVATAEQGLHILTDL